MSGRRVHEALIALGSNIEPEANVRAAMALLAARFGVTGASPTYRCSAVGASAPQPAYLNLVVRLRTDCGPRALREACRRIEEQRGRRRGADRYAPRTLDLDVLLFDDRIADFGTWRLPDPDLAMRPFALVPAADVAPAWRHPLTGRSLGAMRDALDPQARATLRPLRP